MYRFSAARVTFIVRQTSKKDADVADGHGNRSYHIENDMALMK